MLSMAKRASDIETVEQAENAYGGQDAMQRAFRYSAKIKGKTDVAEWKERGAVPRSQQLGLYIGLQQLGRRPSPKLFGVGKWSDLPGWPAKPKRSKRAARKRIVDSIR